MTLNKFMEIMSAMFADYFELSIMDVEGAEEIAATFLDSDLEPVDAVNFCAEKMGLERRDAASLFTLDRTLTTVHQEAAGLFGSATNMAQSFDPVPDLVFF